jgi:hypothetical protein
MKLSMLTLNVGGLQDEKKLRNFIITALASGLKNLRLILYSYKNITSTPSGTSRYEESRKV